MPSATRSAPTRAIFRSDPRQASAIPGPLNVDLRVLAQPGGELHRRDVINHGIFSFVKDLNKGIDPTAQPGREAAAKRSTPIRHRALHPDSMIRWTSGAHRELAALLADCADARRDAFSGLRFRTQPRSRSMPETDRCLPSPDIERAGLSISLPGQLQHLPTHPA
jgi:hypothetical protein